MRVLVLMRGTPSSGKSTWIKENGLENYALSADEIRMLYRSPIIDCNGKKNIDQKTNKDAWKTLYEILEKRMQSGEFTIIDACNSKTSEMNMYKSFAEKYRYRIYCVDFTDISIETAKEWNRNRPEFKQVPESAIDLYYSRFATQKIPSGIKVIKRDEFEKEVFFKEVDLSDYKNIYVIGDIHGCNTALQELLDGGIKEDSYYIFLGDYIDRGIENRDVVKFLLKIKDNNNVCLLEGNHEKWLWKYANDEAIQSKEFILHTKKQLESIDKKDIRQLYRKLRQCILFAYNGQKYLCSHAGISAIKQNLIFTPTCDFIDGVGKYEDVYICQDTFVRENPDIIQIHGHRNPHNLEVKQNDTNYNLEGRVEFGGDLRALIINSNGITIKEIHNDVFSQIEETAEEQNGAEKKIVDLANLLTQLQNNKKSIIEKKFDNISSFNFTRNVFYDKKWNEMTIKARGLFINTDNYTIANRAYEKFFNIGEVKETELEHLSTHLQFPIDCYVKYNGFLGMLGYDEKNDKLLFCSKSNVGGQFSQYFEDIFMAKYSNVAEKILEYIKVNNVSMVFEVIDNENDPHIIKYKEKEIVLLDIVKRQIDFERLEYERLCDFARQYGFKHKEKAYTLNSWSEFLVWYNEVLDKDYSYNGEIIEGFVIEDMKGFMTKIKLDYYKYWKFMRSVADSVMRISKNGNRQGYYARTSALTTAEMNEFYGFLRELSQTNYDGKTDIITLRDLYMKGAD